MLQSGDGAEIRNHDEGVSRRPIGSWVFAARNSNGKNYAESPKRVDRCSPVVASNREVPLPLHRRGK
jgi:hypothetical protein